jgi:hypothetical protein
VSDTGSSDAGPDVAVDAKPEADVVTDASTDHSVGGD